MSTRNRFDKGGSGGTGLRGGFQRAARLLCLALVLPCKALAASQPPPGFELSHTEESAAGGLVAEHYFCESNLLEQIWITVKGGSTNRALLFEHGRHANVLFSPDEKWLVVNDYFGSDSAEPILFRRIKGTRFSRVKEVDFGQLIWKAVSAAQGVRQTMDFDHRYSQADQWLGADTILLRAWGHHSGEYWLEPWFCLYDLKTGRVHFDLAKLNRGAFQKVKKPPPPPAKPKSPGK